MIVSKFRERFQRNKRPKVRFLDLPQDILGLILAEVPVKDHVNCLQTCKYLEYIGNLEWVWRNKYYADFDSDPTLVNWKQSYVWQYRYWASLSPRTTILSNQTSSTTATTATTTAKTISDTDFDENSLVVSAWSDGSVSLWDLESSSRHEILLGPHETVYACLIDSDRNLVYLGVEKGRCLILCTHTMKLSASVLVLDPEEVILRISKCPYGILFAGSRGTMSLMLHHGDKKVVRLRNAHSAAINGLAYSSKHDLIVTLSCHGQVKVWRWSKTHCRFICCRKYTLNSGSSDMTCLAVYEDSFVVSGQADGIIQEYGLMDGNSLGQLVGHQRQVRTMHVDGRYMVTGSYDCTVRLWDLYTKSLLQTIGENAAKSQWVLSVRLKDRKVLYAAGCDCNFLEFR